VHFARQTAEGKDVPMIRRRPEPAREVRTGMSNAAQTAGQQHCLASRRHMSLTRHKISCREPLCMLRSIRARRRALKA
jgi:hypothetical protein